MAGQSARREGVDSKVSGQPSDRYGCLAQFKAKTWHSFPCLLAIVSLFALSLGRVPNAECRVAWPWFIAAAAMAVAAR